ncbi:MAG: DUF4365 domain-containing protein [Bordetella sp.]|uniref:DUF4365 domain-containing protein n=1 Tax=Bordetella sp. TaxID=28081 RepID=UPI003F7C98A8
MRPQSHVIGDIGQATVALAFKKWGWTANICQSDYGEDLECHVFADHQRTPIYFRCQVKSSADAAKHVRRKSSGDFSVSIADSLCREWLLAYFPVLLVVYDDTDGIAYWVNATDAVRARLSGLARKSLTLSVPVKNCLVDGRDAIAAQLSGFYTKLFRIQSEKLERTVLPLLMPRYRNLSYRDSVGYTPVVIGSSMTVEPRVFHRDDMPSWTASLRSLDSRVLHGLEFRAPHTELGTFTERMVMAVENSFEDAQLEDSEWLSFVCGPLHYSVEAESRNSSILQRNLTGWQSYAYVGGRLVHDHDYAFRAPDAYMRQIGRRARSWDGYFYVSLESDIAVQLIAGTCSSPADAANPQTLREHARAQFMPWRCMTSDIDVLQSLLSALDLAFRPLEKSDESENGWVSGAICTTLFEPSIGLFSQARNWRELEHGSVQTRLAESDLIERLPGKHGDPVIGKRLEGELMDAFQEAPSQWLISGPDARTGLPLDLSDRRVIVQRLHVNGNAQIDHAERLERLSQELNAISEGSIKTSLSWQQGTFERIAIVTAAWTPRLYDSSAESLERASFAIIKAFDEVLPRSSSTSSIEVLRFQGEIYFQGDRMF